MNSTVFVRGFLQTLAGMAATLKSIDSVAEYDKTGPALEKLVRAAADLGVAIIAYDAESADEPALHTNLRRRQIAFNGAAYAAWDTLTFVCYSLSLRHGSPAVHKSSAVSGLTKSLREQTSAIGNLVDFMLGGYMTDTQEWYEHTGDPRANRFGRLGDEDGRSGRPERAHDQFPTDADYEAYIAAYRPTFRYSTLGRQLGEALLKATPAELDAALQALESGAFNVGCGVVPRH